MRALIPIFLALAACDRAHPDAAALSAQAAPPEAAPAAPPANDPPAVDITKPGSYASGPWTYTLVVTAAGSRSEGTRGELRFDGKPVPPAVRGQFYETPWGDLVYAGEREVPWDDEGWYLREGSRLEGIAPLPTPGGAPRP